jgi:tetratricopeptide (TPR) repeat protein
VRGRHQDALKSYAAALPELMARERLSPDDYQVQAALALTTLGIRRPADALRYAKRAAALLPVSKDAVEGPLYLYLLAQVHAQTGNPEAAFATLDQLFKVPGFYNEHWVQRDLGFAPLWDHPSFRAQVVRWAMQRGPVLLGKVDQAGRFSTLAHPCGLNTAPFLPGTVTAGCTPGRSTSR